MFTHEPRYTREKKIYFVIGLSLKKPGDHLATTHGDSCGVCVGLRERGRERERGRGREREREWHMQKTQNGSNCG